MLLLPIEGLILCVVKSDEHIELLELQRSEIHVAECLTELPPIDVLRDRLHRMMKQGGPR